MKNLVKNFNSFIFEKVNKSECCGAAIKSDCCEECGMPVEIDAHDLENSGEDMIDPTFEAKKPNRKAVLKAAEEKYPKRSAKEMKKTLGKMKATDFKQKAEKYFGWADDPEAAAAAFIRKATKKEPKDV
jgi:hypothetical protein